MSWNYRLVRKKTIHEELTYYSYDVREVYYDDAGRASMCSQDPDPVSGSTAVEALNGFIMMIDAFSKPILDYDNIPEEGETLTESLEKSMEEVKEGNYFTMEQVREKFNLPEFSMEEIQKEQEEDRLKDEEIYKKFIGHPSEIIQRFVSYLEGKEFYEMDEEDKKELINPKV